MAPPRCPVCGAAAPLALAGDGALCPNCGHLLHWLRSRFGGHVGLGSPFPPDIGLDSLDAVELVMEMESELGVKIPDDDLRRVRTVEDVLRLLTRLLGRNDFA